MFKFLCLDLKPIVVVFFQRKNNMETLNSSTNDIKDLLHHNYYVSPHCCMEVIRHHIAEHHSTIKVHVMIDTPVSEQKFRTCVLTTQSTDKHMYIAPRDLLPASVINFINEKEGKQDHCSRKLSWTIFALYRSRQWVIDPSKLLWGDFMERLEHFVAPSTTTYQSLNLECCVCFSDQYLVKCLKCTTRYCYDCFTKEAFHCYSCGLFMAYNEKKQKVLARVHQTVNANMGSLFKILEIKFGINTQHMFHEWCAKSLTLLLANIYAKQQDQYAKTTKDQRQEEDQQQDPIIKYFHMQRFIVTAQLQFDLWFCPKHNIVKSHQKHILKKKKAVGWVQKKMCL